MPVRNFILDEFNSAELEKIKFHITGIGRKKTENFLSGLELSSGSFMLNVGSAGAINPEIAVGDVIQPDIFIKWPECCEIHAGSSDIRIATSEKPVMRKDTKESIFQQCNAQAVDMEAFYQAEWCQSHNIDFQSIKVISDLAEFMTIAKFRRCLRQVINNLKQPVIERVSDYLRNE